MSSAAPESGPTGAVALLIAYPISPIDMPLMRAPVARRWMDATPEHFAKRCLPLLIANQAGWFLLSGHRLAVTWSGGAGVECLQVEHLDGDPPYAAHSHFGSGILTFTVPYLFRTPEGFNLNVRGPSNMVKDGIAPLEGVVETDWAEATFTVNWKLTRPGHRVVFERGEPVAMIAPQRRGELEGFVPVVRDIATDPDLMDSYVRWLESREAFNAGLAAPDPQAGAQRWQKHYFQGVSVAAQDGRRVRDHQQKLALRDFVDEQ